MIRLLDKKAIGECLSAAAAAAAYNNSHARSLSLHHTTCFGRRCQSRNEMRDAIVEETGLQLWGPCKWFGLAPKKANSPMQCACALSWTGPDPPHPP